MYISSVDSPWCINQCVFFQNKKQHLQKSGYYKWNLNHSPTVDGPARSESPVDGKHPIIDRPLTIPNWWCRISSIHSILIPSGKLT